MITTQRKEKAINKLLTIRQEYMKSAGRDKRGEVFALCIGVGIAEGLKAIEEL